MEINDIVNNFDKDLKMEYNDKNEATNEDELSAKAVKSDNTKVLVHL